MAATDTAAGPFSRSRVTAAAVFIVCAAYYLSFCHYGINLWDEGGLLYGGQRYLQGQKVFRDFLGYPPGIYWIAEGSYRIFGDSVLPLRRVIAVFSAFIPFFVFLIGRRFLSGWWLAAVVLLAVSAPAVYYQRTYAMMFLLAAWAVIVCLEERRRWPWVAAAAAAAYYFKVEVLLITAPLYALMLLAAYGFGRRGWAILTAIGVFFALFFWNELVEFLFFKVQTELQLWGNSFPLPWGSYQGEEPGLFTFLESMLFYLPFAAGIYLGWYAIRAPGLDKGERMKIAALAYLQTGAMALVVMRAGFDNLLRCLPLFFIAAVYAAWLISRSISGPRRRAVMAALALLWLAYMGDLNWRNGFYTGSIGALREVDTEISAGKARGIIATRFDADMILHMTEWIQTATVPGETIFAAPLSPFWYYLSGRANPAFYDWVLPGTLRGPQDEEKLIAQLRAARPALVILVDIALDNRAERRLAAYAPRLTAWVGEEYLYSGNVNYYQIWRRR